MDIIKDALIRTEPVSFLTKNGVATQVLRLDQLHPVISGNKWFKLKFHLQEAKEKEYRSIVTYGGAYSNHIVATAAACAGLGFRSVGIIRGEAPAAYSHTLQTAAQYGMQLIFLSREAYRNKALPPELSAREHYLIPEGGYSERGADGAATIPYNKDAFDLVACAVGTGTMMAGLIKGKAEHARIAGISALKNHTALSREVQNLLGQEDAAIHINHNYHFGGYAKHQPELIQFMNDLYLQTGIPTDFVYTAKLFFGINDLIEQHHFTEGTRLLLVHSGGLQGNLSLRKGTLIF